MKRPPRRIEIAGGIASGKTTLARLLRHIGFIPVHEQFRKNPFYEAFYADPVGTALETEITFLLQHYHEVHRAAKLQRAFCTDFSLVLDRAYANVTLARQDRKLFDALSRRVSAILPERSLLIHLTCPPEIELDRIRRRDRKAERAISLHYLENVDRALKACIKRLTRSEKILSIDSSKLNFAFKAKDRGLALTLVRKALDYSNV